METSPHSQPCSIANNHIAQTQTTNDLSSAMLDELKAEARALDTKFDRKSVARAAASADGVKASPFAELQAAARKANTDRKKATSEMAQEGFSRADGRVRGRRAAGGPGHRRSAPAAATRHGVTHLLTY